MKLTRKVLLNSARTVDFQWPYKNQQLTQQMKKFMQQQQGLGLAANQVGTSLRVFVMLVGDVDRSCFNPEIVSSSEKSVQFNEGCLSFPGQSCIIKRPETVDVKYQDHQGDWHYERFSGMASRVFQHELDHLNGITMWDRYQEQHAE